MGAKTGIEWTDATWNPIRGCTRVSEGCRHCYAESVAYRFSGPGLAYEGLAVLKNGHPSWTGKIEFVEKHLLDPLKWKTPRRIFVNSMSDLFHEGVTDEMCDKIFAVMALCPQHTFQVLTKRPKRMLEYLSANLEAPLAQCAEARIGRMCETIARDRGEDVNAPYWDVFFRWPLRNVWLGVSVENQAAADERIPVLLQTPAAVRFISAEPLLGPLSIDHALFVIGSEKFESRRLDWVICGGESGPGARPMHPEWARGLRDQCASAGVPFFFKQWGEWAPDFTSQPIHMRIDREGRDVTNLPGQWGQFDAPLRRVGKHAAGALLDGQEWKQFPAVSA
jgi:protein gp37